MADPVDIKSILDSVKVNLQVPAAYGAFDPQIVTHINSAFFALKQLGVGPLDRAFTIQNNEKEWSDFVGTHDIEAVKSYMYLKVRMLFDPPTTSFALEHVQKQIQEWEWRLNVAEDTHTPVVVTDRGNGPLWDLTGGIDFPAEAPIGAMGIDLATGNTYKKTS